MSYQATYTKLRSGDWGIRIAAADLSEFRAGTYVQVAKKSGELKHEAIAKIIYARNGIALCAIRRESDGKCQQSRMIRTGCSCGSIEGYPRNSDCASCQHDY